MTQIPTSHSQIDKTRRSLSGALILAQLPVPTITKIEQLCSWHTYTSGQSVVAYGEASDDVFFLVEGHARVLLYSQTGQVVSFRDLGPGETFGELSAIDGGPRSASVETHSECLIARLPAAAFRSLLEAEAGLAQAVLRQQAGAIRRLTSRVHEFSAAVMAVTGRKIYSEIQGIRAQDIYPDEETKAHLLERSFPISAQEMTLKLSSVTAAFYGLMLKHVGQQFGWDEVDGLSRRVFRELGRLKTREAIESGINLPRDCRAPAAVFITAVHSASPEYNFHVFEYLPTDTAVRVFGVSRYDRIAKKLDIEQHLTWPELTPFFEGIAEELQIRCRIETDLRYLGEAGSYDCTYRILAN